MPPPFPTRRSSDLRIDDQGAARKRLLAEICRRGDDPPRPPRPQPQRDRRDRGRDARRPAGAGAPLSDRRPGAGHQGGERQGGNVGGRLHRSATGRDFTATPSLALTVDNIRIIYASYIRAACVKSASPFLPFVLSLSKPRPFSCYA